jgi:hypothetical protein
VKDHPVIWACRCQGPSQGFKFTTNPYVQNPPILSPAEEVEAGGGLKLHPVLGPGAAGQGVLLQGLPPGRRLKVGLTRPVGVAALWAAQAELFPAGVI